MRRMENAEYKVVVKELQALVGSRFEKIRKVGGAYKLKLGSRAVLCEPGVRIHISRLAESGSKDGFCEKIDKELKGFKLLSVTKPKDDRIIVFDFGSKKLICEMFGKGNIILTEENIIVWALRYEEWSTRSIKKGGQYVLPPPPLFEYTEKFVIVPLISRIGKKYARIILKELAIDEQKAGVSLKEEEKKSIEDKINMLLNTKTFYANEEDFSLLPFENARPFSTLSEAADFFYIHKPVKDPKLEKLKKRLEAQKKRLKELKKEEERYRIIAERIYENYALLEKLLKEAREGKIKLNKDRAFEVEI